jgi:hypothetical protein
VQHPLLLVLHAILIRWRGRDGRLSIRCRLFVREARVAQAQREREQRHAEADARDAQQPLRVLVRVHDALPLGRAERVPNDCGERRGVHFERERLVRQPLRELARQNLRPDSTADRGAEGGPNVVPISVATTVKPRRAADGLGRLHGEVQCRDHRKVLVLGDGLEQSVSPIL